MSISKEALESRIRADIATARKWAESFEGEIAAAHARFVTAETREDAEMAYYEYTKLIKKTMEWGDRARDFKEALTLLTSAGNLAPSEGPL